MLFRVAAMTGLRRGELGGLRWRDLDLDLDAGMLTVRRGQVKVAGEWTFAEPKTQAGRRTLDIGPATVAALRRQRQALLERRMVLGAGWSEGDLVFPGLTGGPADLDAWGKSFRRAIRDAGAPPIRLHDYADVGTTTTCATPTPRTC